MRPDRTLSLPLWLAVLAALPLSGCVEEELAPGSGAVAPVVEGTGLEDWLAGWLASGNVPLGEEFECDNEEDCDAECKEQMEQLDGRTCICLGKRGGGSYCQVFGPPGGGDGGGSWARWRSATSTTLPATPTGPEWATPATMTTTRRRRRSGSCRSSAAGA